MKRHDQTIHTKTDESNSTQASRGLQAWDRVYRVLALGILITGLSGLLLMAWITWLHPDQPVQFTTMAIFQVCIITAFGLAAFANDRVTRRYAGKRHFMATEQIASASR